MVAPVGRLGGGPSGALNGPGAGALGGRWRRWWWQDRRRSARCARARMHTGRRWPCPECIGSGRTSGGKKRASSISMPGRGRGLCSAPGRPGGSCGPWCGCPSAGRRRRRAARSVSPRRPASSQSSRRAASAGVWPISAMPPGMHQWLLSRRRSSSTSPRSLKTRLSTPTAGETRLQAPASKMVLIWSSGASSASAAILAASRHRLVCALGLVDVGGELLPEGRGAPELVGDEVQLLLEGDFTIGSWCVAVTDGVPQEEEVAACQVHQVRQHDRLVEGDPGVAVAFVQREGLVQRGPDDVEDVARSADVRVDVLAERSDLLGDELDAESSRISRRQVTAGSPPSWGSSRPPKPAQHSG